MKNEKEYIEILLEKYSNLISDSIGFGSKLIDWDIEKRPSSDEDLPPILFLRNILELGDAISILIKNPLLTLVK